MSQYIHVSSPQCRTRTYIKTASICSRMWQSSNTVEPPSFDVGFFHVTFNFIDPKLVYSLYNLLHIRCSLVLCSNPLSPKETLNGGIPVHWSLLTNQNCIHKEIIRRLKLGDVCDHSVQNLSSSCLLYQNVKIRIYKSVMLRSSLLLM
jgi:hypothetical protein